jgi:hypothetical protein
MRASHFADLLPGHVFQGVRQIEQAVVAGIEVSQVTLG